MKLSKNSIKKQNSLSRYTHIHILYIYIYFFYLKDKTVSLLSSFYHFENRCVDPNVMIRSMTENGKDKNIGVCACA